MEMRTIKFRCWDGKTMKLDQESKYWLSQGFDEGTNKHFMQFTGLFDKTGKEIFEGDIIQFNTLGGNQMVYEVKWKEKGFGPVRMSSHNQEEITVIGNIYENPDMTAYVNRHLK